MGLLTPKLKIRYFKDLNLEELKRAGFKAIFLDYDNTLAPWRTEAVTRDAADFIEQAKELGFSLVMISNATGKRGKQISDTLGILYFSRAKKPWPKAFQVAMEKLGLKRKEVLCIGDQIYTDVFGANLAGLKAVLISPICKKEFVGTKVLRFFERIIGVKVEYKENDH